MGSVTLNKPAIVQTPNGVVGVSDTGWIPDSAYPWVVTAIARGNFTVQDGDVQKTVSTREFRVQGKSETAPSMGLPERMLKEYARYVLHGGDRAWLHLWDTHLQQIEEYAKEHPELSPHEQAHPVGSNISFVLPKNRLQITEGEVVAWNPRNGCYWVRSPKCSWLLCVAESLLEENYEPEPEP